MTTPSTDRTALVTGGATGIGLGIAEAFLREGTRVAITRNASPVPDALADRVVAERMDATDSAEVTETVARLAHALGGRIDVLVNNAGGLVARRATDGMDDEHWHHVIDLNLSSVFYVVRAALPFMAEGGRIVNISSLAAHNGGGAGAAAYAAAKAGVEGFTRALAKELGPRGIAVSAVAPGLILETPFHERFTPQADQQATIAATPLRRAGTPADVAATTLYLASDAGGFASGTVVAVNGAAAFH
ncbi:SDR family NAD(P)-dependent oxidoreductase [Humibacter sp.]|jgi:3-oxoacyl-[acyl-carrier protein] reductase|uniref:SDR family NAD(P)-dependent oxidoreductase n=1 Tax=Humibacter sp. TaxID=1940291 RepID=UPI002C133237|nr:SDR family NAD(P)-dependent oxidoreductase [Humibacter sp.]HVX07999.1 SDR family NAD(P)-dependent oxidoreductase [Humibacter sp.]